MIQTLCQTSEVNLHHFVLLDDHIDGGKGVKDLLYLGGVVSHPHVFLPDVAQLLSWL